MALLASSSPQQFTAEHLHTLLINWNGIRDGDVESVHEGRVATRRIRAALPLLAQVTRADQRLFRDIGRRLGQVRELDVAEALLTDLESRFPALASGIAALRRDIRSQQHRARTKMVKTFDRVDMRAEAQHLSHPRFTRQFAGYWRDTHSDIRRQMASTSRELSTAIGQAAGVYMPNRLHAVRISLKKLRYSIEVATDIRAVAGAHILPDFKKAQDTLGRLRDCQVLLKQVQQYESTKDAAHVTEELAVIDAVLAADCQMLHRKYLSKREQLLALCRLCLRLARPQPLVHVARVAVRTLPALAIAAAPIVLLWPDTVAGSTHHLPE